MPIVDVSPGVSVAYQGFGDPGDAPVLLVMGFGAQMIAWHEDLCRALADRGRYVIRYDNRDCGLSTKFDDHPVDMGEFITAVSSGDLPSALAMVPYRLQDMADDGLGLLTALGIERAHVVREMVWASKRYGDPAVLRELAADSYDRAYYPAGVGRQLGAMILSGSRADALQKLQVPTLVIHGLDDTLIDPSGGRRTADLVPGAELLLIPDMGHDRPRELWPEIIDAVETHTG
jgi:pimeloyl-ACP methyl ester carboxylesterase